MERFTKVLMQKNPDGLPKVKVRRWVIGDDGKVAYKEFLLPDGQWVKVPPMADTPDECYLPLAVYPAPETSEVQGP